MSGNIFVVKGISGSGKSSRVFQLLKFFENKGYTLSDFYYTNIEGKKKLIGVLVEEENLIFIGKLYKSGNVERWQGYDAATSSFKKSAYFSEFLKENSGKYSFIVEGAGVTGTYRLRPVFLEEIGFFNIIIQYYNYPLNAKQDYYNRIIYRSGEKPKKDVMWSKNLGMIRDSKKSEEEILKCNSANVHVFKNEFNEHISDFGKKYFMFTNQGEMVNGFLNFVKEFDYINKNKFENFK